MTPSFNFDLCDFGNPEKKPVQVTVKLKGPLLSFSFLVTGESSERFSGLLPEKLRTRKDDLWKADCFEIFWSFGGDDYYEFNLASSGDWQVYHFLSERKGRTEAQLRAPKLSSLRGAEGFQIQGELNLVPAGSGQILKVHPCVILYDSSLGIRYFAPAHSEGAPDFHNQSYWRVI